MISRKFISALTLSLFAIPLLVVTGCAPSTPSKFSNVGISPDSLQFKPATPEQWTLANGLTVFFMRDAELPLVQGALYTRGGSFWEPFNKAGVMGALGDQMRDGGAGLRSAAALDRELEELSAAVSSSMGTEYGRFAFSALSADFDRAFALFSDVVRSPRFEPSRLELWRGRVLEGIRRRNDDPDTVAGIAFSQLLYGNTPYGRVTRSDDIKQITREDLLSVHSAFIRPEGAILAITGNVERASVEAAVRKQFGDWGRRTENETRVPPPIPHQPRPGIYFINYPGEQATILMGHRGVPRLTPDYAAIEAFNDIFGGGFGSRLFKRVRTELGFAYGISGGISAGLVEGTNYIGLQTKVDSTGPAMAESIAVLQQLQSLPISDEEMRRVTLGISNSFVFKFGSPGRVVERRALLSLLGYPSDYDAGHLQKIAALTVGDIKSVAAGRWDPKKFVLVVVGDKRAYSSIEKARADPQSLLFGVPLKELKFDEAVVF